MIQNALRWLMNDSEERARLALCSINLSGQSLADDKFLPFVIDELRRSGIDASRICFEITETAAIASFSQANRFITALRELGCKFALDDFGTGLSSFAYLKHFPVDFLKIDGSFVKEMPHDPIDREMVRAINEIGHLTGKRTIAEFAESQEIINMLRDMKVDYAQGYAIAEPRRLMDRRRISPELIYRGPTTSGSTPPRGWQIPTCTEATRGAPPVSCSYVDRRTSAGAQPTRRRAVRGKKRRRRWRDALRVPPCAAARLPRRR